LQERSRAVVDNFARGVSIYEPFDPSRITVSFEGQYQVMKDHFVFPAEDEINLILGIEKL
jgi:hypothetical protein